MRHLLLLPVLYALCVAGSCESETAPPLDLEADYAYFPLELNRSLYYEMDSIVLFNTVAGVIYDTTKAEVRETLVERFVEADGTTSYRGERWQRNAPEDPWFFVQTYVLSRETERAVRREDNLAFTKLVFPIRNNRKWDGHTAFDDNRDIVIGGEFLNVFFGWNYRYLEVGEPVTLATGVDLPAAVFVEQDTTSNLIDRRIAHERYAPGIGLVERYIDARHTQCRVCCNANTATCAPLPWEEKAEKGFILHQVLVRAD